MKLPYSPLIFINLNGRQNMFSYFITHRALEDIVSAYQALIIGVIIQNEL